MRFIERILHKHPNHVETRELLGIVQVEIGEVDLAREVSLFVSSVSLRCICVRMTDSHVCDW